MKSRCIVFYPLVNWQKKKTHQAYHKDHCCLNLVTYMVHYALGYTTRNADTQKLLEITVRSSSQLNLEDASIQLKILKKFRSHHNFCATDRERKKRHKKCAEKRGL